MNNVGRWILFKSLMIIFILLALFPMVLIGNYIEANGSGVIGIMLTGYAYVSIMYKIAFFIGGKSDSNKGVGNE